MKQLFALLLLIASLSYCNSNGEDPVDPAVIPPGSGIPPPQELSYTIIAQYPHDTSAYTQGLQLHEGKMYEGTGDYENSSLRVTDYKTGKVEKSYNISTGKIFGEGINIFNGKLYQLTWKNNLVYVYDLKDLGKPVKTLTWPYEGWGITNNGTDLIISDGTSNIYFVNPEDFKVRNTISVKTHLGPVDSINELEYIDGSIYANVYNENVIVRIDPESGIINGIMHFPELIPATEKHSRIDVLNGIAWDSTSRSLFITGKRWPKMFEVKFN